MYMPRKILKYEYKLQGTDLCNPRKCWDEQIWKTQDLQWIILVIVWIILVFKFENIKPSSELMNC